MLTVLLKCQRIMAIVPLQPNFKTPQTLLIMLQTSVMSMTDTVLSYTNKQCAHVHAHVWPYTYQETPERTIKHAHTCTCARAHTHIAHGEKTNVNWDCYNHATVYY